MNLTCEGAEELRIWLTAKEKEVVETAEAEEAELAAANGKSQTDESSDKR